MNVRSLLLASAVPTALVATCLATPATAGEAGPGDRRPHPVTELVGQYDLPRTDLRQNLITVSRWGLRFVGGGAGNRLTVTEVGDQVRYVDRAATSWKSLPSVCRRISVPTGIGAQCRVPRQFEGKRTYLEIYPRLGNDRVDASTMSRRFRMWVLTDAGNDSVSTGAGDDFVNTAFGRDTATGGAGNDWIRVGDASNAAFGGPGADYVTGGPGADRLAGGPGDDRIFGSDGRDRLRGDDGADLLNGGGGRDLAVRDRADRVTGCEVVRR